MSDDTFNRNKAAAFGRGERRRRHLEDGLDHHQGERPAQPPEVPMTSLERLRVAQAEPQQQNEELLAARQALQEERRCQRELFDFVPDGYLVTDPTGIICEANRAAAILLKENQDSLAGKSVLFFVARQDRGRLGALLAGMAERERVEDWALLLAPQKSEPFPAAITVFAMHDTYGERTWLSWLIRDVTEREQEREALRKAHHEAEHHVEECIAVLGASNEQLMQKIRELEHAEVAIEERLRFEALLSGLSTQFLNLPPSEVDQQIERGLQRIAEFLGVDGSTLLGLSEDRRHLRATHAWTAAGCEPAPASVAFDRLPWVTETILRGQMVLFSRVGDLPAEATRDKEFLRRGGLKSAVAIPLAAAGSATGAVAFLALRNERSWPEGLVQRLRLVADIFSNALTRKQADESLQAAFSEIRKLQQQLQAENLYLREEIKGKHNFDEIIGQSDALKDVLAKAAQVAPSGATVLLLGETGVGKELVARSIHQLSLRKNRPMLKVNCAALPTNLIESELFGHEKGAFTGAHARQAGRFELANGGTLFLDEIGELPLEQQAKLLRVLQDGEFERLGSSRTIKADIRVIAATNRDLEEEIRNGRFRKDLYYRLQVFQITVPPLRERREDIPLLVCSLVQRFAQKAGKTIHAVPADAMEALKNYPWPGNVRELENVIERALIINQGPTLRLMDTLVAPAVAGLPINRPKTLAQAEAECIARALEETHWKIEGKSGAAAVLGLSPSTLRRRMQRLGIHRPDPLR